MKAFFMLLSALLSALGGLALYRLVETGDPRWMASVLLGFGVGFISFKFSRESVL